MYVIPIDLFLISIDFFLFCIAFLFTFLKCNVSIIATKMTILMYPYIRFCSISLKYVINCAYLGNKKRFCSCTLDAWVNRMALFVISYKRISTWGARNFNHISSDIDSLVGVGERPTRFIYWKWGLSRRFFRVHVLRSFRVIVDRSTGASWWLPIIHFVIYVCIYWRLILLPTYIMSNN